MTSQNKPAPTPPSTSSDGRKLGCLIMCLAGGGWAVVVILGLVALLAGCASAPGGRWEALSVAGTGHTAVFHNGLARAGPYEIVATGAGQARFYRAGKYMGTGTLSVIEPDNGYVRIEVSPNANITITGQ